MKEDAHKWAGPSAPLATSSELADHLAICQLPKTYALGFDLRDYDLARSAFAPDAVGVGPEGFVPMDAYLKNMYATASSYHATQHFIGAQNVSLNGDEALVWSYAVAHHKVAPGEARDELIAGVIYRDRCRRYSGGWLIQERDLTLNWMDRGPAPKSSQPA